MNIYKVLKFDYVNHKYIDLNVTIYGISQQDAKSKNPEYSNSIFILKRIPVEDDFGLWLKYLNNKKLKN